MCQSSSINDELMRTMVYERVVSVTSMEVISVVLSHPILCPVVREWWAGAD